MKLNKRSVGFWVFLAVLFLFVTLGIGTVILLLIWVHKVSSEVIEELNCADIDPPANNVLLMIFGGVFYYAWWNYKISRYLSTIERKNDIEPDFWAPVFSQYFGLIQHQSRINSIVSTKKYL